MSQPDHPSEDAARPNLEQELDSPQALSLTAMNEDDAPRVACVETEQIRVSFWGIPGDAMQNYFDERN